MIAIAKATRRIIDVIDSTFGIRRVYAVQADSPSEAMQRVRELVQPELRDGIKYITVSQYVDDWWSYHVQMKHDFKGEQSALIGA